MSYISPNQSGENLESTSTLHVQDITLNPIMEKIAIRKPEHKTGDRVYYNLPDSTLGLGIVLLSCYVLEYDIFQFLVSWGEGLEPMWHEEIELSSSPVF